EFTLSGKERLQRATREIAVADLATRGTAQELHFTDRERREVVVEKKSLERFALEVFDLLRFLRRAEGDGDECLCFAAREDGGTVRAREIAELDRDRTDLVELAAVDALPFVENDVAENLPLHLFDRGFRRGDLLGVLDRNRGEN